MRPVDIQQSKIIIFLIKDNLIYDKINILFTSLNSLCILNYYIIFSNYISISKLYETIL